jgi:hypothetical protein
MRGALTGRVSELNRNYHIPISNTAAATVVYDNQKEATLRPRSAASLLHHPVGVYSDPCGA